jgi:tRNA threonylcarbamoyl adenosine modification protein YjeE
VKLRTASEEQTMALAARIAEALLPGDIVTLDGPLGAGKTCFVRGLARGLGIDPAQVSSPTFIIRQEYDGPDVTLTHIDGYRVTGPDELETIGWDELLDCSETIVVIEWPSRLDSAVADRVTLAVTFEHISAGQRELTVEWSETDRSRFEKAFDDGEAEAGE